MKMKGLFALFAVFALAVCMAMPTSAKAAVHDDDVGFCQGTVIATNFTAEPFQMVIENSTCTFIETVTNVPLGLRMIKPKDTTLTPRYWCAADTKASLCEATLNINKNYCAPIFPHRKFGKDIRRLSCES